MSERILYIRGDGEPAKTVEKVLSGSKWAVKSCEPRTAPHLLEIGIPDCVVLFSHEPIDSVQTLLEQVRRVDDNLPVIVILSARSAVDEAVQLMKRGAHDVVVWPVEASHLQRLLEHAIRMYRLTKRIFLLESQMGNGWRGKFDDLIGQSATMQALFQMIHTVAPSQATVLITGESGTGKELVARAIHRRSKRAKMPFMDLNCGAIPRELLENELFGHERGSFTGAERRYIGCCERASGGTLFLDEICEMEPALQVKILRLLQERTFSRVGGVEKISADLRFVAATNRSIQEEVEKGRFREDLYYRLNVVPIHLAPLRERPEDIPVLAQNFLERFAHRLEKPFIEFSPEVIEILVEYQWPGNVRELENMVERIVVLNNDTRVKGKHLPPHIKKTPRVAELQRTVALAADSQAILPLDVVEKYAIESALEKCVGNVTETAKRLKIGQATLYRKIRQYGLRH